LAVAAVLSLGGWALAERLEDTDYLPLDHPAIQYAQSETQDVVGRLDDAIDKGQVKLDYAPGGLGYLPAVLKALNVNADSQVLVFSRTSIQGTHISPRTPRAIYFNDDVSVGFVQNGDVLEFAALDPKQGIQLYVMDAAQARKPGLGKRPDCLNCHLGGITLGIPGMVVSSVHPASDMTRDMHGSAFITDQRTPFKDRWGGWYVTGTHGAQAHLGNNTELVDPVHPGNASKVGTQNVTKLDDKFDTSKYLAPASDIVALMVLEHQTRMTNLLIRIGWDARIALHDGTPLDKLNGEIDEMVNYMLFLDEDKLREPVTGVSTFSKTFPQSGPQDKQHRSLRDFDLHTRLFKYPLSYMIYSKAFDALPDIVKERVYRRLFDLLTAEEKESRSNQAVLEILRETKLDLPEYWTANARR
jgi:hypothetical protein